MQLVAIFCVGTTHHELGTECACVEHGKSPKTSHLDLEMEGGAAGEAASHALLAFAAMLLTAARPHRVHFLSNQNTSIFPQHAEPAPKAGGGSPKNHRTGLHQKALRMRNV